MNFSFEIKIFNWTELKSNDLEAVVELLQWSFVTLWHHTETESHTKIYNSLLLIKAVFVQRRFMFWDLHNVTVQCQNAQKKINKFITILKYSVSLHRESERISNPEHAVPHTNHFSSSGKSSSPAEGLQQAVRGEVTELRLERDREECYVYSKEVPDDPVRIISSGEMEIEGHSLTGAHSRPPSTAPTHRNGLSSGMPPDQNGNVVYKRGLIPRSDTEKKVQRKTALAQVEHWMKVQKGEPKRSVLLWI